MKNEKPNQSLVATDLRLRPLGPNALQRTRRTVLIVLGCSAAVIGLFALLAPDNEPRYQGRRLSQWLALYSYDAMTEDKEAAHAIRTIGTNGIPFYMKWIRQEPPSWQRTARRKLPDFIKDSAPGNLLIDGPGADRAHGAVLGIGLLGTNAAIAIPELKSLMNGKAHPRTASRALMALSNIGAPAYPVLVTALADTNQVYRERLVTYMGAFMAPDVGTNLILPHVKSALNDPDPLLRKAASYVVTRLTPEVLTNAVPP